MTNPVTDSAQTWQPIATAPRDGKWLLLLLVNGELVRAYWSAELLFADAAGHPGFAGGWETETVSSFGYQESVTLRADEPLAWHPLPVVTPEWLSVTK